MSPQVPEGLAERLEEIAAITRAPDATTRLLVSERLRDAAAIVRFWERVAPFLDDDTIRLAEAAADVAEVLPDGWTLRRTGDGCLIATEGDREVWVSPPLGGSMWHWAARPGFLESSFTNYAPTPADAARAALAALSGDPK